jgi:integrase
MRHRTTMQRKAQAYLEHRRSLGFGLQSRGYLLLKFTKFLDRAGHRGPLKTDLAMRWVNLSATVSRNYRAERLSVVRCFARHLAVRDGRSEVPDRQLVPKKAFHQRPHIYGERELEQLLRAAGRMTPIYKLRPLTYQTLLGLLACTGLRISEALKLTGGQVDLDHGVLRIEQTKFKKSRLAPLHPTATQALRRYAAARDLRWGRRDNAAFFVGGNGLALPYGTVRRAFRRLCNTLGWHKGNGELPRPRIHDLRHSFACRRLLRWYRRGQNVHNLVAALSTYLGHGKVTDTYWYLTGTPQLMSIAGDRFEHFASLADGRKP